MKIIALGFGQHTTAKEEVKNLIQYSFEEGNYKAKANTSKNGNIVTVDIYRIGSSARIYEIDAKSSSGYVIRRNKRIEEEAILTIHHNRMFDRWNNIGYHI